MGISTQIRTSPVFTLLLCVLLSGCSLFGSSEEEPEVAEIPTTGATLVDTPEQELFERGKRQYESELYLISRDSWESLVQGYPVGPYAEYAEIKAADCLFSLREFSEALGEYEGILKNRPGSPALDYVLLRAGRSSQLANRGAGRDLSPLEKSIELYERLLKEYPESPYAEAARRYLASAQHTIADHHQMIMAFYEKKEHTNAFASRKEEYDSTWGALLQDSIEQGPKIVLAKRTTQADSSPHIFSVTTQTQTARASLGGTRPPVLRRAIKLEQPFPQDNEETITEPLQPEQAGQNFIRQVRCFDNGFPTVQIHLQREITRDKLPPDELQAHDGLIRFRLPLEPTEARAFECFGEEGLKVEADGSIILGTDRNADVFILNHPPRIMLVLQEKSE